MTSETSRNDDGIPRVKTENCVGEGIRNLIYPMLNHQNKHIKKRGRGHTALFDFISILFRVSIFFFFFLPPVLMVFPLLAMYNRCNSFVGGWSRKNFVLTAVSLAAYTL